MATNPKEFYSNFPSVYKNALKTLEKRSEFPATNHGYYEQRDGRILGYVSTYSKLPTPRNQAVVSTKDTKIPTNSKSLAYIVTSSKIATAASPRVHLSPNFTKVNAEVVEKMDLLVPDPAMRTDERTKQRISDPRDRDFIYTVSKKNTPTARKYGLTSRHASSTTNLIQTKTNSIEPYRQKLVNILNEIKKIKSDKIELTRDLATYEANFSIHTDLTAKVQKFKMFSRDLPDIYSNLKFMDSKESDILAQMNAGLHSINSLETEYIHSKDVSSDILLDRYNVKLPSDIYKLKTLFKGVRKISGKRCIVSIYSDANYRNIEVSINTEEGKSFRKYPIPSNTSIINRIRLQNLTISQIEKGILSHSYFLYYENKLSLNYDDDCSVSFFTVCMHIKGLDHERSLILKQEGDGLLIILTEPYVEKRIPCAAVLENFSLSYDRIESVSKILKSRLKYFQDLGMNSLEWLAHETDSFKEKESSSRLLDEEYIRTQIAEENFILYHKCKKEIYNKKFSIKLLRCQEILKIRLKYQLKVIELSQDSKEFKFITSLQGASLLDSPLTYIKSIEFGKTISKLFK